MTVGTAARRGLALVVLVSLAPATMVAALGADAQDPLSSLAGRPADRLLVLSLPTLAWSDLHAGDTPHLDALLDRSAVGALSVRGVEPTTDAPDGYATVSAGARARGVAHGGEVLEPDEGFLSTPAGAVFERNTGHVVAEGLLSFGFPSMVRRNESLEFDAEVGALGEALRAAGLARAAIANADGSSVLPGPIFERLAATALVDGRGVVEGGAVGPSLLEADPAAPFGVRLSLDAVLDAFEVAWSRGGVVLVEGSDLARVNRYERLAAPAQRARLRRDALRHTDALVGGLLERVDAEADAVLVVAPYHRRDDVHLTVAGMRRPGLDPGVLRSGTTRRTGVVTLVDVAPTILDLVGVDRPDAMEGRRFERATSGAATGADRAAALVDLDEAARHRDRMVVPVAVVFVVLQAILWIAAAWALSRDHARARTIVGWAALALLAYLPATYLAGLVDFHDAPTPAYWVFVAGAATTMASAAAIAGRRQRVDPLLWALAAVYGCLALDMLLGAPLQLNTVFGYSPTVGGRFAGMGNLAFGQFAGAAFMLCGLLLRRIAPRRIALGVGFGVLVFSIVIDGMPIWGSDVGGVLAMVPAVGVTAALALGHRLRWRSGAAWGVLAVGIVGVFAALDLMRPPDRRTHLGRLVEAIGSQGVGALQTVASRKLLANLSVVTGSIWTAMVPIALGFIVFLLWRAPGKIRLIRDLLPESLAGLAVVGFLGFALNDSGIAVPGIMLGVVNASLVYLTLQTLPDDVARSAP